MLGSIAMLAFLVLAFALILIVGAIITVVYAVFAASYDIDWRIVVLLILGTLFVLVLSTLPALWLIG